MNGKYTFGIREDTYYEWGKGHFGDGQKGDI